jgi:hypothetical protein
MHHDMVTCFVEVLRQARAGPTARETYAVFDGAAPRPNLHMDIATTLAALSGASDPNIRDKRCLLDMTVSNPSGKSAIETYHTDTRAGALAAVKEDFKHRHYAGTFNRAMAVLVPISLEVYGRLGREGEHFLKQLAEHAAGVSGLPKSRLISKWRQLLSVGLQRAVSRRELLYVQKLRDRGVEHVRPIEHMWDLIEDHTAAAALGAGGAGDGGW